MNNNIVAYLNMIVNTDVGMDDTITANLHKIPNEYPRLNNCICTYNNIVTNGISRSNKRPEMSSEDIIITERIIRKYHAFPFWTRNLTINNNHRSRGT